jgi:hypothetical protein
LDFLWLCCGYWTMRPSNLEAFCEGLMGSTQLFIMNWGGKRHLVSRSGAQQVCTLDLLNCLLTNSADRQGKILSI